MTNEQKLLAVLSDATFAMGLGLEIFSMAQKLFLSAKAAAEGAEITPEQLAESKALREASGKILDDLLAKKADSPT